MKEVGELRFIMGCTARNMACERLNETSLAALSKAAHLDDIVQLTFDQLKLPHTYTKEELYGTGVSAPE